MDRLEGEHKIAEAWHREVEDICERWLRQDHLSGQEGAQIKRLLTSLSDLYRAPIAMEEHEAFPVAQAELSETAKQAIGRQMASRPGVPFIPELLVLSHSER